MVQIKDDVVIHGKGLEHDKRLRSVLETFLNYGLTLRREKCKLGVPEVKWFRHIYSKQGMTVDTERKQIIRDWKRPEDKKEVKSFLQTVAFCRVFNADVTQHLKTDYCQAY